MHTRYYNEHMSEEKNSSFIGEAIRFALITLVIVLPIRFFIAEPFIVSGSSMEPTFENGQYLIVDRLSYRLREPERGEVVVFRYPFDQSKHFIKRIIGLPGETVILDGKSIIIKNKAHPGGFAVDQSYARENGRNELTSILEDNEYFVMGDNRQFSSDSRLWGPLPKQYLVGRVYVRLLPVRHAALLPGDESPRKIPATVDHNEKQ